MSRTQKIVFIALGLIALLFVVALVGGQTQTDCRGSASECSRNYEPETAIKSLGGLFAAFSPRAKLPQSRYAFASTGQREETVAAADDEMRTLKLRLSEGRMALRFMAAGPVDEALKGQADNVDLPRDAKQPADRNKLSFAVGPAGGTLVMTCTTAPCTLEAD